MTALTEELREKIRSYFPRYPNKQAVTLPALHLVQDEMRCVPREAIREIADMLDLAPAEVHDAMTFYGFFREENNPLGKRRLWVCRSLACSLRGSEELLDHLCEKLEVQSGGTTADGAISVELAECIGACEIAPCMLVDDKREGPLRRDVAVSIIAWLDQLRGKEAASPKLLAAIGNKRTIAFAVEGSDERRNLQHCRANALSLLGLIVLQEDARKIEALEEFLHGTQERLGLFNYGNAVEAEIHVKEFMLRHCRLLGISAEDQVVLQEMLRGYYRAKDFSHDH